MRSGKLVLLIVILHLSLHVYSQSDGNKNTVYVNLTNPVIFGGKSFIVGYERTIGKHQSFTFNIGRFSIPRLIGGTGADSIQVTDNTNEKGFHIGADYRFYLQKENKHEAPHGVYIGPYYTYNSFSRDNDWYMNTSSFTGNVGTDLNLHIHTVGVQLGYQFIFWKRLAVDFIMFGPGLGMYNLKSGINTNMSPDQEALFFQKLNEFLSDKIPGYNKVIDEGEFEKKGAARTTTFGYRFMINVGFRF